MASALKSKCKEHSEHLSKAVPHSEFVMLITEHFVNIWHATYAAVSLYGVTAEPPQLNVMNFSLIAKFKRATWRERDGKEIRGKNT